MTFELEELAALDAIGALTHDQRRAFESALSAAPAETRREVAAYRDAAVAIAEAWPADTSPSPDLRARLMARITASGQPMPSGFSIRRGTEHDWLPHPVPGIRMKVLAVNRDRGYATLLLDVEPGTRFPAHHHAGAEECYVISGSVFSSDRHLSAGDFLHADADTHHGELWTEEGCLVLLIVPPEDELPDRQ